VFILRDTLAACIPVVISASRNTLRNRMCCIKIYVYDVNWLFFVR
jgi:hypothetical protein